MAKKELTKEIEWMQNVTHEMHAGYDDGCVLCLRARIAELEAKVRTSDVEMDALANARNLAQMHGQTKLAETLAQMFDARRRTNAAIAAARKDGE